MRLDDDAGGRSRRTLRGRPQYIRALRAADALLVGTKRTISLAALSLLREEIDAFAKVRAALQSVDHARAALRVFADGEIDSEPR